MDIAPSPTATMTVVPVDPPPSSWRLPDPAGDPTAGDLIGIGADLEPGTLLNAYRSGLFPMPLTGEIDIPPNVTAVGWWSPDPRGVLPLDGLRISRSLRRACRDFEIRVDTSFDEVLAGCADPDRDHGWIDSAITDAYRRLHGLGWVHSVEAWSHDDGALAGGLYGVAVGGLFAGESMFHRRTDASKVALVGIVSLLRDLGYELLDVQWRTGHLASLGVVDVPRPQYLARLRKAVERPTRPWPAGPVRDALAGALR